MTSVNLALTMAATGAQGDPHRRRPPAADDRHGLRRRSPLERLRAAVARQRAARARAPPRRRAHRNLQLLLANPEHAHLVDLLQRNRLEAVLAQLQEYADVIIIDSPPLTEVADALPLADVVDTILVSVRLGRSRRDKLEQLRRALAQRGVTPAGFVVTSRRVVKRPAYGYEYQGVERQTAEVEELKVRRSKVEVGPGE